MGGGGNIIFNGHIGILYRTVIIYKSFSLTKGNVIYVCMNNIRSYFTVKITLYNDFKI